jgi:hypothetical protein
MLHNTKIDKLKVRDFLPFPEFEININNSNREYFFSEVKTNNGEGYLIADKKQKNIIDFNLTNQTTTIYLNVIRK